MAGEMTEEPEDAPCGPLTQANAQIHDGHEEAILRLIEDLTELDIPGARRGLRSLSIDMKAHLAVEDASTHQVYGALTDHPRGAAPALFEADHVSHAKVMRACEEALAKVDGAAPDLRRQVVLILPLFYRLRSVLEHHTLREQRFLYPRLDAELSPGEIEVLVTELTTPGES